MTVTTGRPWWGSPQSWGGEPSPSKTRRMGQPAIPASGTRAQEPHHDRRRRSAGAQGYHAVSIAEIGAAAGITGSGVYRHFDSKSAVLVALFDQIIDDLLRDQKHVLETTTDLGKALDQLIAGQVEFVVGKRELAQVYHNEINSARGGPPPASPQTTPLSRGMGSSRQRDAHRTQRCRLTNAGARRRIGASSRRCSTAPDWLKTGCGSSCRRGPRRARAGR